MKTNDSLSELMIARTSPGSWWRRVADVFGGQVDAVEVRELAEQILQVPLLQAWLLTAAGQSRRARRALLARAAEALASELHDAQLAHVFKRMRKPRVHDAVVDELFRRGGLEPLAKGSRSGRGAHVRLAHLGECLGTAVAA